MGNDTVIPNAVILSTDPSGQTSPAKANSVAKASTKVQIMTLGKDSIIPIIYGGPERVAGRLYFARIYQSKLLMVLILCEGVVEEVGVVDMNDAVLPAGITITKYTGSQVAVDPTLAAAIPGFTEVMAGTAYMVILVPKGKATGIPRFTALVKGLKVYNPRGNAIQFGATSYVSGGNLSGLVATNGPATIEGWYNFSQFAVARGANNVLHSQLYQHVANNYFYLGGAGADYFAVGATLSLGVWYHIAVTYTGFHENSILYINGVAYPVTIQSPNSSHATLNPMTISSAAGLMGTADELRVWNVVRTPEQILDYMNKRAIGTESGLVACWHMDESSGTTTADATTNAFTGTLTNTPTRVVGRVLQPVTASLQSAWSDNPALCLADFLASTVYGARKTVNWNSVAIAADYCDGLVGAEKRNLLTLTLNQKRSVKEWIDALRSYVPGWVIYDFGIASIIPDMPGTVSNLFNSTNIDSSPFPIFRRRGIRDVPSVMEIGFMRTDITPWAMDYAIADTGATIRRKTRVDLPGIRRYSQAKRFSVERLNHANLEGVEGQLSVFEEGLKVSIGDINDIDNVLITTPGTPIKFRVMATEDVGHGRWVLAIRKYDPDAYSNLVDTSPANPDTGRPDPTIVQPATDLVINETVYLEKSVSADSLVRGLIYQSRFDVSWVASIHAYTVLYRIKFYDGTLVIHEGTTNGLTYSSPPVQQAKSYTVDIIAQNSLGFDSAIVTGSKTALGKLLVPGNVPSIKNALEIGGELLLEIEPAIDVDIIGYEWRYGPVGSFTWAGATFIDFSDGQRFRFKGLPVGPWRFAVKARDSVGNYSVTETTVDRTITSDSDAFAQDHEFIAPVLTNMMALTPIEAGGWKKRWVTAMAADAWDSIMPSPIDSGSSPVDSYHSSATSKFQGESWDLGSPVTGDWQLTPNVTDLTGVATYAIETSDDGSAWTARSGLSWKGTTRYVRPVMQTLTTGTMLVTAPPKISITAVTRNEAGGPLTSNASGAKTVTLINRYTSAVKIGIVPRGTAGRTATIDNVIVGTGVDNSFDVYMHDVVTGNQVASSFTWDWEGF